jgi:hypothetical protein
MPCVISTQTIMTNSTKTTSAITTATSKLDVVASQLAKKFSISLDDAKHAIQNSEFKTENMRNHAIACAKQYNKKQSKKTVVTKPVEIAVENTAKKTTAKPTTKKTTKLSAVIAKLNPVKPTVEIEPATEKPISMLKRMRNAAMPPIITVSKKYAMNCVAELRFFADNRKLFTPTKTELALMTEIANEILPTLHKTNEHVSKSVTIDRAVDNKSMFKLNDYAYVISVRYSRA